LILETNHEQKKEYNFDLYQRNKQRMIESYICICMYNTKKREEEERRGYLQSS